MRILFYPPKKLYKNAGLVDYLSTHLNNDADHAVDQFGYSIGSGMKSALTWKREMFTWVCWLAGRPVAWGTLTPRFDSPNKFGISIFVSKDFRCSGMGTKLVKRIQKFVLQNNLIIVASPWNKTGKDFYDKNKIAQTTNFDLWTQKIKCFPNENS
jgi:hypothetical protein